MKRKRLSYAPESAARLTRAEEKHVLKDLAARLPKALDYPAVVDDGYDTTIRLSDSGTHLVVGRSGIYESWAKRRMTDRPRPGSLRGLFYPGAMPPDSTLYLAALYFDEVFLVHPGSSVLGARGRHGSRAAAREPDPAAAAVYSAKHRAFLDRLEAFDAEVLPLKRAGILWALPPQMQDDPAFLRLITADLGDPDFRAIASQQWDAPVFVAAAKVDPLLPLLGAGLDDPDEIREALSNRVTLSPPSGDGPDLFQSRFWGMKEVHPTLAATILLNHAHLLSERLQLIPFTDDRVSLRLMQSKLDRLAQMPGYADFKRELQLSTSLLAMRVLEERLPSFKFSSFDDLVQAREKLGGPLRDFREAMSAFVADIEESPHSPRFQRQIERIVAGRIKPAITALEQEIRTSRDSFIAKCVRNTQTGSIPIVASLFAGLPASLVVGISAGVVTFEAAIETYLEVRRKKRNGLTLFLRSNA